MDMNTGMIIEVNIPEDVVPCGQISENPVTEKRIIKKHEVIKVRLS